MPSNIHSAIVLFWFKGTIKEVEFYIKFDLEMESGRTMIFKVQVVSLQNIVSREIDLFYILEY